MFRNSRFGDPAMSQRPLTNQVPARRTPRQARAQHKVGLMLEAAMQLLEHGEVAALTTNAVAARAGVSIGSLYQYFGDKQALLDALIARELGAMSEKVLQALNTPPKAAGDRVRGVVHAVLASYGGRGSVHRRLIEHSLTRSGGGSRLSPMFEQLQQALRSGGAPPPGEPAVELGAAQAYVLTHALAGVLRMLAGSENRPPLRQVEDALVLLVTSYVEAVRREHVAPSKPRIVSSTR